MTSANWLNLETAIGATLPCGATVVRALDIGDGLFNVTFDRKPKNDKSLNAYGALGRSFRSDGCHSVGHLPDLIPPRKTLPAKNMADAAATAARLGITAEQVADAWEDAGVPVQRADPLTLALREVVRGCGFIADECTDEALDDTGFMLAARAVNERAIAIAQGVRDSTPFDHSTTGQYINGFYAACNAILKKLAGQA